MAAFQAALMRGLGARQPENQNCLIVCHRLSGKANAVDIFSCPIMPTKAAWK